MIREDLGKTRMKTQRMLLSVYMGIMALAAYLALIVLLITTTVSKLGLIAALLLFVPLPGLLRGSRYVHAWASMMLVVYCALLLANGYAQPRTDRKSTRLNSSH